MAGGSCLCSSLTAQLPPRFPPTRRQARVSLNRFSNTYSASTKPAPDMWSYPEHPASPIDCLFLLQVHSKKWPRHSGISWVFRNVNQCSRHSIPCLYNEKQIFLQQLRLFSVKESVCNRVPYIIVRNDTKCKTHRSLSRISHFFLRFTFYIRVTCATATIIFSL